MLWICKVGLKTQFALKTSGGSMLL